MFWVGWSIALVAGLLSVEVVRRMVRTKYPRAKDLHIDIVLVLFLLLGLGISAREHRASVHEEGTIQRFVVVAAATLAGDWSSGQVPDFANLIRMGSRSSDLRIQITTSDHTARWVDLSTSEAPRMTAQQDGRWVLDYSGEASAGSWVLGAHRDDLKTCDRVSFRLYGIGHGITKDNRISLEEVVLLLHVNGVQRLRCIFHGPTTTLTEDMTPPVLLNLPGPVAIEAIG